MARHEGIKIKIELKKKHPAVKSSKFQMTTEKIKKKTCDKSLSIHICTKRNQGESVQNIEMQTFSK